MDLNLAYRNFKRIVLLFLACTALLSFSACSVLSIRQPKAPVSLTLSQLILVQDKIVVKAHLEVFSVMNTDEIVLGAVGLEDSKVIEEAYTMLSDISHSDAAYPNEKYEVIFELLRKDLTHFKLLCSWGADAKELKEIKLASLDFAEIDKPQQISLEESESSSTRELADVPVISPQVNGSLVQSDKVQGENPTSPMQIRKVSLSLEDPDCVDCSSDKNLKLVMRGELYNRSPSAVGDIALAFGLFWSADGTVPSYPSDLEPKTFNEKVLSFSDIVLGAGESLPFEIVIGDQPPEVPGGKFIPHLRLLTYSSEK